MTKGGWGRVGGRGTTTGVNDSLANIAEDDEDDDDSSSPYNQAALHCSKKKSQPEMMSLSTGKALVGPKVDCWLSFEEFLQFTRWVAIVRG